MKKIIIIAICFVLILGCEKKEQNEINDLQFTHNSFEIKPGIMFNNIKYLLNETNDIRSITSNYNEQEANVYEYDNFEIETYYDNNQNEKIYSIRLTNAQEQTNEGIKIGDTIDNMISTYGQKYELLSDNVYLYNFDDINITFTINDNKINEIVYYLK